MSKEIESIDYITLHLSCIIKFYIENAMKEKDWRIEAIDDIRNKVILIRSNYERDGKNE